MPMPAYPIVCLTPGCKQPAAYKIAAAWTDGVTAELKTYSLCCAECLPEAFRRSRQKQAVCRLAQGEKLEVPGVYRLARGQRDQQLERLPQLEEELVRTL
jgi:hypothetical protein